METTGIKTTDKLAHCSSLSAKKLYHAEITDRIIAAAITVHKLLGPGFLESIYEEALAIELNLMEITYQRQQAIEIRYRGSIIGRHRLDLVVANKIVVELKAVKDIDPTHIATCISYLRATHLPVGLIINYSEAKIKVKRVINTAEMKIN